MMLIKDILSIFGNTIITSCRTIGSSVLFLKMDSRVGRAAVFFICPRQYASSCFNRAEESLKPLWTLVSMDGKNEDYIVSHPPFAIIPTASSDFKLFKVNNARKRVCS